MEYFNLGGLAGFPFAGNIGFDTMAKHIPDDGFCLIVYGPHIGITKDGVFGKVERQGVALVDDCCRSAVEAMNGIMAGSAGFPIQSAAVGIEAFTNFQQNTVEELMTPIVEDRLVNLPDPIIDLPFALYKTQNELVRDIVVAGARKTKKGMALLGGIQINPGPGSPDFFHPLCFDYMDNNGSILEDILPELLK